MIIIKDSSNVVLFAKESFNEKEQIWFNETIHTMEIVNFIPDNFKGRYYTYVNDVWEKTSYGIEQIAILAAVEAEKEEKEQKKIANLNNLSNDTLIRLLKTNTLAEIETYIEGSFSNLAKMTDTDIDNYLDTNVTDLASAVSALKILAKDLSQTMSLLKVVTKITIYLIKKDL